MGLETGLLLLVIVIILALTFDYINGFHDAANAIATVVSTRVLSPRWAVMYGATLNFVGALLGTEVAATIGKGLVDPAAITMDIVVFALIGAIGWNIFTWWLGLPTSSSHALIGSLLGAAFFSSPAGWQSIEWVKLTKKVVIPMFGSPLAGFAIGFAIMLTLAWVVYKVSLHRINWFFGKLQIASAGWMALSHGHNDAQKSMGIIALALLTYSQMGGELPAYVYDADGGFVPMWVMVSCAIMMGLGTLTGGWKIIRTMGQKMIKLQPIHGFAAETTASSIIMVASEWGIPLSTTHTISSSIMGVGATKRMSAVKWGIVGNIVWAWILTIPMTFLASGALVYIYRLLT